MLREWPAIDVQVWDLAAALDAANSADDSKLAQMLVTAAVAAHDKDINAVVVSPNDALVVTASQDRTAKVTSLLCMYNLWCTRVPPAYGPAHVNVAFA
jgi:WD40 repeat protein